MKLLTQLRQAFPNQTIVELNNGAGCNIHFDYGTVSVWFKKKKYGNDKGWFKYDSLDDLISEMDKYINPKPKVAVIVSEAPRKSMSDIIRDMQSEIKTPNGTQKPASTISSKRPSTEKRTG